jgi:hypothetical protein
MPIHKCISSSQSANSQFGTVIPCLHEAIGDGDYVDELHMRISVMFCLSNVPFLIGLVNSSICQKLTIIIFRLNVTLLDVFSSSNLNSFTDTQFPWTLLNPFMNMDQSTIFQY